MTSTNPDHLHLNAAERCKLTGKLTEVSGWLATALDGTVARQTAHPAGTRGRRGRKATDETPLPYHPHAAQVADDLHATLSAWAQAIAVARQLPAPGRLSTVAAARWLAEPRHITELALMPDAGVALDEICHAVDRAIAAVDRPRTPSYVGACTVCGADLWAHPDDDPIACTGCPAQIPRADQDRRIDTELRSRLFTARELVDIVDARLGLTITPKTVHNLTRSRIGVRGRTPAGEALFRCGDVLTALTPPPRRRLRTRHAATSDT